MKNKPNLLEMKPRRNPRVLWNREDIITLQIKRENPVDRFMHKLFRTPNTITLELDEIGSFVWSNCDGSKNIYEISEELKEKFGDKINPVLDRLLQYIKLLLGNKLIGLE